MIAISFEHIPPPTPRDVAAEYYTRGWNFADDALGRYGPDTCATMRRQMRITSSYEQGAADRFDGKPNKYGKG